MNKDLKCKICNKKFKNTGWLSRHLNKEHKISFQQYYDKYFLENKNEKYCNNPSCNNKSNFKNWKGYSKYCSSKCANEIINSDKNVINKKIQNMKKTIKEKYRVDNISQSKQWKNKCKKTWNNKSKKELKEISNKSKQTKLEKYGNENFNNIEKNKQTKLEKYGNKNFNNRNKFKNTMLKTYGVEWAMQSNEIKEKQLNTLNEKYGGIGLKSNIIKEKIQNTNLEKYGSKSALGNKNIRNKIKNTMQEKYNGIGFGSEIINRKIQNTNLEKYGNKFISKSEIIKNKIKQNNLKKYKVEYFTQSLYYKRKRFEKRYKRLLKNKFIKPLFNLDDFSGIDKNYKFKCLKCNKIYKSTFINHNHLPLCSNCFKFDGNISSYEKEIRFFIENELNIKNIQYNKRLINKKELDIYIPDFNLAIELDGIYYHSEISGGKDKKYHLEKTKLCNKKGIKLLHIWDIEWINKQDIVKSIIKNNLNIYDKKIGARECQIKLIIDNKIKNQFLNKNHIQGEDKSSIKLGLFYKNELVSLMTFVKSRYNKNYEWEISRFCNKLNYVIIGSANKLFKHFIKNYNPKSIITYSDIRFFDGKIYEKLNFDFLEDTNPNYFYIKGNNIYSRIYFQKYKLEEKIEYFDKNLTEWENMQLNKFDRIWDCGNKKYIWKKD